MAIAECQTENMAKEYNVYMYSAGTWAKNKHSFSRHMIINLNFNPSQVQRTAHFKAGMWSCLWQAMYCSYYSFVYRQRCVTFLCWSVWQNWPFKLQLMCLGRWLILSIYHQTASSLFKNMLKNVDTDLGAHNKPWCNANLYNTWVSSLQWQHPIKGLQQWGRDRCYWSVEVPSY